jgi:S-adenosylmethionine hydrolase
MTRPIFLLSDFGMSDTYVGIVKAVILGIAPDAQIVDLTHDVPPQDIWAGAFALLTAAPYLPPDAVALAVVDPGVGTTRRPIAVQIGQRAFIGPDNGLLSWAVQILAQAPSPQAPSFGQGGFDSLPVAADMSVFVLDQEDAWLPKVSATFHGRDLFAPVTALVAGGASLHEVGSPTDQMVRFLFPTPKVTRNPAGKIIAASGTVIHVDRFGNLVTSIRPTDLPIGPCVSIADRTILGLAPHFQSAAGGGLIALIGSADLMEIAVPNGSAADLLGVGVGEQVTASAEYPRAMADVVAPPGS